MIYAIFMLLVLLTLVASWRRSHVLELALFAATVAWLLAHLVGDMTMPLTLSF